MNQDSMRKYMDAVRGRAVELDEGIIDTIKNWISKLSAPIRRQGQAMVGQFEQWLKNRYSAKIPEKVKSMNKSWMWSKMTYQDLYKFASEHMQATEEEINKALRNPIVNNHVKVLSRASSTGRPPALPLTVDTIQFNTNVVSTMIDKETKQFFSKAIATAVIDGIAYIQQASADVPPPRPSPATGIRSTSSDPGPVARASATVPTSPDDIKSLVSRIEAGLAKMKGTA